MVAKTPQPLKTSETQDPGSQLTYKVLGLLCLLMLAILASAAVLLKQRNERALTESSTPAHYEDANTLTPLESRYRLNEILDQAINAQGGRLFLERLSTVRKLGTLTQDEATLTVNYAFKRPNRLRYRLESDERGHRIGYDGSRAWIQGFNPDGLGRPQLLASQDAARLVLTSEIALPAIIFFDEAQYISLIGEELVEGHLCHVIKYEGPLRASQSFYIDQESFILRKRTRQARFRDEDTTEVAVIFSDFQMLNGISTPYRETVYFDGELQTTFAIEHISLNPGILDSYFTIPPGL